jgi:hypothetical protein
MTTKRKPVEVWALVSEAGQVEFHEPTAKEAAACLRWWEREGIRARGETRIVHLIEDTPELRAQRAVVMAAEKWDASQAGVLRSVDVALRRAVERYLKAKGKGVKK